MTSARVCAPPAGHLLTPQNAALLFTGDVSTPLRGSARWTALLVKNAVSTVCQERGHAGCCDNSPGRHATAHFRSAGHPVIRSYEPGEGWYWCYIDQFAFELEGAQPAPSHP